MDVKYFISLKFEFRKYLFILINLVVSQIVRTSGSTLCERLTCNAS